MKLWAASEKFAVITDLFRVGCVLEVGFLHYNIYGVPTWIENVKYFSKLFLCVSVFICLYTPDLYDFPLCLCVLLL